MFTGIVQGVATVAAITDKPGLRSFTLAFAPGFTEGLRVGASVSVDGVCLTVTNLKEKDAADFDVIQQSLALTTLGALRQGHRVNAERAALEGAEVGGHPLSGHIDFAAPVAAIRRPQNNWVLRIAVPAPWMRYLFAKGYVAVNGASLTLAEIYRDADGSGWFEVWLIPETLRMTTFVEKEIGADVNVEIDRQTQIIVDTMREAIVQPLSSIQSAIETLLDAASIDRASLSTGGLGEMATANRMKSKTGKLKARDDDGPGPHAMQPRDDDGPGPHAMQPRDDDGPGPHDTPATDDGPGPHVKTKKATKKSVKKSAKKSSKKSSKKSAAKKSPKKKK
jgi:riboflavin synthase